MGYTDSLSAIFFEHAAQTRNEQQVIAQRLLSATDHQVRMAKMGYVLISTPEPFLDV
ncbi:MAG: hypothetical protein AB8B88_11075 [Devosiaceae bacterium]